MLSEANAGYGKILILRDVTIQVDAGEIVCIVGANGAGKTTLMRTISAIIPLQKGRKVFEGRDITKLSPAKLTGLGLVHIPEGRLVIKDLSVTDNLLLGAYANYFKMKKDELEGELASVYRLFPVLKNRAAQKAGTLSGGEQQMLAIGRGLMAGPKLLMLDEPSLGLAPLLVKEMFKTISELNEQGLSILLVEQNVRASLQIADRAYIMQTGAVQLQGRAKELLTDERVKQAYLGA